MAQELQMMFGVLVQIIREDDEEMDIINELANLSTVEELVVNQNVRLHPTTFIAITNYVQDTVSRYPDYLFKQHFRMRRNTFTVII
jgi:hypothetical protein